MASRIATQSDAYNIGGKNLLDMLLINVAQLL